MNWRRVKSSVAKFTILKYVMIIFVFIIDGLLSLINFHYWSTFYQYWPLINNIKQSQYCSDLEIWENKNPFYWVGLLNRFQKNVVVDWS